MTFMADNYVKKLTKTGSGYAMYFPLECVRRSGEDAEFLMTINEDDTITLVPTKEVQPHGEKIKSKTTAL